MAIHGRAPEIILGASARAAAQSAKRAGCAPWCIDLFADRDLRRMAAVRRFLRAVAFERELIGSSIESIRQVRDGARPTERPDRPTAPMPLGLPSRRVDLFFVRGLAQGAFRHARVADRYGSDPHPLVGTLRVRRAPCAHPRRDL